MKTSYYTFLPLLGGATGVVTILFVYYLTWKHGHLPDGVLTPPISLLGCNSPEHEAYQIGFTITGILLWRSIEYWKVTICYPFLFQQTKFLSWIMLIGGYMAAIGVVGQGVVTLEENLLENIKVQPMAQQSVNHQILALVFFLGAAMHCYSTLFVCYVGKKTTNPENPENNDTNNRQESSILTYSKWSVRLKTICVLLSLVSWLIAERFHPTNAPNMDKRGFAVGGLAQYITVISYILFFGSYSIDFHRLEKEQQTSMTSKREKKKLSRIFFERK